MQRPRLRTVIPALAILAALMLALLGGTFARAAFAAPASNRPQTYLALGDSVAFGYSPILDHSNASNFIGYPDIAAAALKETLANASCPGETSGSMIVLGAPDNGCKAYRNAFPLHVSYGTAQLAFADAYLRANPKTLVVSINIGANDLFLLERACLGSIPCILAGLPGMLQTLSTNLDTIYSHIRGLDGYHHKIVALTYYSLNYSDPTGTAVISQINQVVADRTLAWGGVVADGFGAFAATAAGFGGDSCAAGLLIVLSSSPLVCNIHPSPAGRDLLAQAIVSALR